MDNDTSWCPACERAIVPKRYQVPVHTQQAPPPPPSPARRTKSRAKQGLVQGTGALKEQQPVRYRTVIDQGPTPLYCSDQCHLVELHRSPHSASSISSITSSSSASSKPPKQKQPKVSKSLALLAQKYNWAPIPPAPPVLDDEPAVGVATPPTYDDGLLMTGRRIKSFLPPPQRRDNLGHIIPPKEPRPIVPGWNDGSNGWRSSVYGLTTPESSSPPQHKSFATRGSRGVQSTFSSPRDTSSTPTNVISPEDVQRMEKWNNSFRRASSHVSTPSTACPSPISSASYPPSRHERPLLRPGAEGKLLVPNVMMKVNSSSSISSQYSAPPARSRFRSPLSQECSSDEEEPVQPPVQPPKRPTVETRSWSYDNIKTYPIMRLPPKTKMEKRKEIRVVDGEQIEVEYEVEVEIHEEPKRLFLFASSMPAART